MAQDIEEFLRMAAARKKQQTQQPPQGASQQQPPQNQPVQVTRNPNPPSRLVQQREPDLYIGEEVKQDSLHPDLKSSVRPTVSTDDIAEHAANLGDRVNSRTEYVESRVQSKFDHDLGSLSKNDLTAPDVVDHGRGLENLPDLSNVFELLRHPSSLKQAFVLKEIFDRPKF